MNDDIRKQIYQILGLPFGSLKSESGNDWNRALKTLEEDSNIDTSNLGRDFSKPKIYKNKKRNVLEDIKQISVQFMPDMKKSEKTIMTIYYKEPIMIKGYMRSSVKYNIELGIALEKLEKFNEYRESQKLKDGNLFDNNNNR